MEPMPKRFGGLLALLAVTLTGFATFDSPVSTPVLVGVTVTGLLAVFVLPLARCLLPFALAGVGLTGIGLVLTEANGQFVQQNWRGPVLPGAEIVSNGDAGWLRAVLLLLAFGFLAAAAWLTWRAAHRLSRLARPAGGSPYLWGPLLSAVLGVMVVLLAPWYGLHWTVAAAAVLVVGLLMLAPEAAADVASVGLILLGLCIVAFAVHPPQVVAASIWLSPYYYEDGSISPLAIMTGVQGAAIRAHAKLLLRPDAKLADRVQQLTQTRAEAVDSAAAELRRVERDLHDGAQARLVALGMSLRAAERVIETSPQAALALLAEAIQASSLALNELRDLVRGIYPPVLADRGLADAIRALALDTPLRTETDIELPGRLDPPVEAACYFAVAEALANAVKHSGARLIQIRIRHSADRPGSRQRSRAGHSPGVLRITVTDDGVGGADPARGTGLCGVERRLGTFDGILAVSSPPGGPTMIIMEVPGALSAPGAPRLNLARSTAW
jgi:signal transduction histidine kinase